MKYLKIVGLGIAFICSSALADNTQPSILAGNFYRHISNFPDTEIQFKYQACDRNNNCLPQINTSSMIGEDSYDSTNYGWLNQPQGCTYDVIKILEATVYIHMKSPNQQHTTKFDDGSCIATNGQTVAFREFGSSESLLCEISNNSPKI